MALNFYYLECIYSKIHQGHEFGLVPFACFGIGHVHDGEARLPQIPPCDEGVSQDP
jgi:hypothetical protein